MAVAGNMPTASFLTNLGKMQSAWCRLCRIAREARGESTDGLATETHGHSNSAGCTTVTAAHHSIWRHLYDSMHAAQRPKRKFEFVTLDKQSNVSVLWRRREFLRICRGRSGVEGTGNRGDKNSQKKSGNTIQPRSSVLLRKLFLGQSTGWGRNQ